MSISYKDAGVDVTRGYKQVALIRDMVESTHNKNVLSSIGGFGGLFGLDLEGMEEPVLVSGTDGVGTKLMISQMMDKHTSVGIDLVAMCLNDIICLGAKPLFFLDYIATGHLDPEKMSLIVQGITDGLKMGDCALIGGETAEMPGLYGPDEYDLAGFAVGIVDKAKIIDGSKLKEGDVLIGLESSGVHSNGMSLARAIVFDKMGYFHDHYVEELGRTIGEELLEPTRIYVKEILDLLKKVDIKAISNITGGGIYENIPRVLNGKFDSKIDINQLEVPKVFKLLEEWGNVDPKEMYGTFNMGIGMVLVVDEKDQDQVIEHFKDYKAAKIGRLTAGTGEVEIDF